ncbi:chloramphenicol acetyltransferase [Clostridium sp. MCC353]|uniref:CatA-like O-acetyltransferase n=1 Tax=Clostridium sp. MCC353 TaxID=2592646 RepID=UPI001C02DA81|nr:CatA-like O-acetyltransferase [Clostridium sp. MCC353]MBT9776374.1 chloramphenicol acetyltransferase [Clostridium sp. MCC353]
METYRFIDTETFDRAGYFHYFMSKGTTIEFTAKIDVTSAVRKCKGESVNFQSYLLFKLYQVVNTIENFKYDIVEGRLAAWEKIVPTFSSFSQKTKLFFTLYADMKESYSEFDREYKKTVANYADSNTIVPQGDLPPNIFNVSCIPWLHFEHFSSNSKLGETQIIKMITLGKYEDINGKYMCPFTVQVSHAIADGYHVSLLFEKLQKELNVN